VKTLIFGASGQVGTAFGRLLPEAIAWTRADLDLRETGRIRPLIEDLAPDRIINCAAYTAVDAAEDDEETARLVNGTAVGEMADAAAGLGIPLVTFSTDYVFDGESDEFYTETSEPNPLNAYGRSKVVAEDLALAYPGSLVIRTSWLFSATHPNFVAAILARAVQGLVRVVDDQWGRPTSATTLAAATLAALDDETVGLLHIASPPTTTWFGLAREACRLAGLGAESVVPCASAEFPRPAIRPRRAVLVTERGADLADWHLDLGEWLRSGEHCDSSDGHPAVQSPSD